MSCNVCVTEYNKSKHKKITCKCGYDCCRQCVIDYTMNTVKDIHCMSCKIEWTHEFLYEILDKTFVNKIYKEHRQKILFELELSLIPRSLPVLEARRTTAKIKEQIDKLKIERTYISNRIYQLENEVRRNEQPKETRIFTFKCPSNNCKGFVDDKLTCPICDKVSCGKCRELKSEDHICDENTLANIACMKKDAKACPSCGMMISKISGCDQMFCIECHTTFSWRTLQIDTGNIHNPHYFEYMAKIKQPIDRNPMDVICGRELNTRFTVTFIPNYPYQVKNSYNPFYCTILETIMNTLRHTVHIKEVVLRRFLTPVGRDNNLDIRIEYMENIIDEKKFKSLISAREKQRIKSKKIAHVLGMYVTCVTDIFYRIHDLNLKSKQSGLELPKSLKEYAELHCELLIELEELRKYSNEHLEKISNNFNNKPYVIEDNLGINNILKLKKEYLDMLN